MEFLLCSRMCTGGEIHSTRPAALLRDDIRAAGKEKRQEQWQGDRHYSQRFLRKLWQSISPQQSHSCRGCEKTGMAWWHSTLKTLVERQQCFGGTVTYQLRNRIGGQMDKRDLVTDLSVYFGTGWKGWKWTYTGCKRLKVVKMRCFWLICYIVTRFREKKVTQMDWLSMEVKI